jgi:2-polyprenyl-3-methyl-5-hydroxy-6-metoxy-1,4-benzoquinol methylase
MTQQTTQYFFDKGEADEQARLGGISAMFDPLTVRTLIAAGVAPGWRCLEVGAGTGTIARWLAGAVGPSGRVTATDIDLRFLDELPGVEVIRHDVTCDPLEPGTYDLVHARMVVEHLPDRADVISRLAAALRPGGVLVLEDLIFGGPVTAAVEPATRPVEFGPVLTRCTDAFAAGLTAAGADTHFGGKLPAALAAAGLQDIEAEFTHRLIYGGSPESAFYRHNFLERGDKLVSVGLLQQEDLDRGLLATSDPAASWFTCGLVTAWGRTA